MKKKKLGTLLVYFCFILMGIIVVVAVLYELSNYDRFIKDAEYTKGEIVSIQRIIKRNSTDDDYDYRVNVKYTVDGEEYLTVSKHYSASMHKGKSIGVYYDKNNPSDSIVEKSWFAKYWPIGLGILFILVGLISCINILRSLNRIDVYRDGIKEYAEVISVKKINSQKTSEGKSPYKVTVEYRNFETGECKTYVSHDIWDSKVENLTPGDKVSIYIDEKHKDNYIVDVESVINDRFKN